MKTEKDHNKKSPILAIIIISIVVLALFLIIRALLSSGSDYTNPNGLIADDKVEQLAKDSIRKQIISYNTPQLIDTTNLVYIIPASLKTLANKEHIGAEPELTDKSIEGSFSRSKHYGNSFSTFNNLIVYDYPKNKSVKICDERLAAADMSVYYFDDEIIIIFKVANKDTNKDNSITLADHCSLYIYSLTDRELYKASVDNSTFLSYQFVPNTKDLLITFGNDRNRDGVYDYIEPIFIFKYDYAVKSLNPLVDEQLNSEIQKLIDML